MLRIVKIKLRLYKKIKFLCYNVKGHARACPYIKSKGENHGNTKTIKIIQFYQKL